MPTPYAYVGIIGGVVALGFLIYSIFTNGPEPERRYENRGNGQSRTNFEPGYDRPREADWGANEDNSSSTFGQSRRRRRADKPECVICHELIENEEVKKTLACNHTFHRNCIQKWFDVLVGNGKQLTCPVCRVRV